MPQELAHDTMAYPENMSEQLYKVTEFFGNYYYQDNANRTTSCFMTSRRFKSNTKI